MWLANAAWSVYEKKYGKSQTMERMAERGGFGQAEFIWLLRGAVETQEESDLIQTMVKGRK